MSIKSRQPCVSNCCSVTIPILKTILSTASYFKQGKWLDHGGSSCDSGEDNASVPAPTLLSAGARTLSKVILDSDHDTSEHSSLSSDSDVGSGDFETCEGNIVWDSDQLQQSVNSTASCKKCGATLRMFSRNSRAWNMFSWLCSGKQCQNNNPNTAAWTDTSKPAGGGMHAINRALVLGMRAVGKGWTAATTLSGMLNSPAPIHPFNWGRHTKQWADKAAVVEKDVSDSELQKIVVDIPASLDGSWKSRSQSCQVVSRVVAVIYVDTAEVLDAHVACSTCPTCKRLEDKDKSSLEYLSWYVKHGITCRMNHDGSAQAMEAARAIMVYRRSLENSVRYNPFVGDGDSKSYKTVATDKPCGPNYDIEKEECIGHIQKRMGTPLRREVEKSKGNYIFVLKYICSQV